MNAILKKLDLSSIQADKSSSLHKLLKTRIASDEFLANVMVADLDHVYITDEAEASLNACYLTGTFVLDKFCKHYQKNLMAVVTRGKLKGTKYVNVDANEFVHPTDGARDILVVGKCIEIDNRIVRQVHITCRPRQPVKATESEDTLTETNL